MKRIGCQWSIKFAFSLCLLHVILQLFLFTTSLSSITGVPSEVLIGGLFHTFDFATDSSGLNTIIVPNELGNLQLAAFMMAVDSINNHTDGIFDDVLVGTKLIVSVNINQDAVSTGISNDFSDGATAAYYVMANAIVGTNNFPLGIVNALNDDAATVSVEVFNAWYINNMITYSHISDLTHGTTTPYELRLIPSDFYAGAVIYQVIKHFHWKKIALVYTTDVLGQDAYQVFSYMAQKDQDIEYLTIQSYSPTTNDLSSYLNVIQSSGATIIVLLMNDKSTGQFLYQAYRNGLLEYGTQVVGMGLETSIAEVYAAGATSSTIHDIMWGYLNVKSQPSLYYQSTLGKQFLSKFRNLPPTRYVDSYGDITCSLRKDDTGMPNTELYQYVSSSSYVSTTCLGIESFEKFQPDGSNLDPNVMYVYAAVQAYALVIDYLTQFNIDLSSELVYLVISNTTINGGHEIASLIGNISFFDGIPTSDNFAEGERFTGNIYVLQNFNFYYDSNTINSSVYNLVGTIEDSGVTLCDDDDDHINNNSMYTYDYDCQTIIYRTLPNGLSVPSDTKPDKYQNFSSSIDILFIFFGSVIIFLSILSMIMYSYYRDTKAINNAQFKIIVIMTIAILIGGVRVLLAASTVTIELCTAKLWTQHIAFRLLYGSLMLKLWRIHRIINTNGIQRVKITENDILKYIASHFALLLLLLIVISGLGGISVSDITTTSANQSTLQPACSYGVWYLYLTRAVPPIVNETKVLAPTILGSIFVIVLCAVLIFVLNMDLAMVEITVTSGFIGICIPVSITYATQKYLLVRTELAKKEAAAVAKSQGNRKSSINTMGNIGRRASGMLNGATVQPTEINSEKEAEEEFAHALAIVKKKASYIEKAKVIQRNVDIWKTLLLRIADESDGTDGSMGTTVGIAVNQVNPHYVIASKSIAYESINVQGKSEAV